MRVVFPLLFRKCLKGSREMALKKVSILLILSIFGMTVRVWSDPVKSIHRAAIQLTPMKMDENNAPVLKKTRPATGSPEWSRKDQAGVRDVSLLSTLEEKERSQWMESMDKVIYSREFSENGSRSRLSSSLHATETKSPSSEYGQSALKAYSDESGLLEQARTFTKLRLLQSREETFKEIFMGICFSLDLTSGHMFLEMNVTPSTEKRSGFSIRF